MDHVREWLRRIWYLLNRRRFEAALREEMAAHRADMASPARFGNALRLREEAADVWGWRWLDDLGRDLRLGLRTLRRSPGFTIASIAILSVGIGINLAFFHVVNAALLQPLHVKDPQSVFFNYQAKTFSSNRVPYPVAQFLREETDALSAVLVSRADALAWSAIDDQPVDGEYVSVNWFDELGAAPAAGRLFHQGTDDAPSATAVVVLSHRFWQRQYGGKSDVIGRTIRVNGQPAIIAGVVEAQFPDLKTAGTQFWIPIEQIDYFQPASHVRTDWSAQSVQMYGRLRRGVSAASAKASLAATLDQLAAIQPKEIQPGQWLEPYSGQVRFMPPDERQRMWTMTAAVAALTVIVLVVTCLNLSNLTLARATSRVREMSIRTALGAGRWRVMRHLVIESVLLSSAGALGGWLLGVGAAAIIASAIEASPVIGFSLDWRMMLAGSSAALVAALAIGLAPAWKIGRQDLALAARDGGERASQGLHGARIRHWLVAGQIAGSFVLLVFAGQMLRGLQRALEARQGFSVNQLAVLEPPPDAFSSAASRQSFLDDVGAIVSAQPDTDGVTLVSEAPLGNIISTTQFAVAPQIHFQVTSVDPLFFRTMAIPILAGRAIEQGDKEATAVVVSRRGAVAIYGTADVVGRHFPGGHTGPVIVGVAADARLSSSQAADMAELYQPLSPGRASALIVRAKVDPARILAPLRDASRAVDGRVIPQIRLMRDDFERGLREPRLASTIAGLTAMLALVLALVGVFGVVAYGVGLRRKEIGIRLALGAGPGAVVRQLLRYTIWSGAVGLVVGLAGGWPFGTALAGAPFYLRRLDVAAYASIGVILVVTGVFAAFLPAWRTVSNDPFGPLRGE
jgi:predicted permease